jgi:hypothetical protein
MQLYDVLYLRVKVYYTFIYLVAFSSKAMNPLGCSASYVLFHTW